MSLDLTRGREADPVRSDGQARRGIGARILASSRSLVVGITGLNALRAACLASGAFVATRLLPPHDRGVMVLGATVASVATLAAGLGIGSALRARLPTVADETSRHRLLSAYGWCSIVAMVGACTIAVLISASSGSMIDPGLASPAVLVAVATVAAGFTVMNQVAEPWIASGRHRIGSAWTTGIAIAGIAGIFGGALVIRTASFLLLAQGMAMVITALVLVVWKRRSGLFSLGRPTLPDVSYLMWRGARAAGLWLGLGVALRLDRYVLGVASGPAAVAVYSLAGTFSAVSGLAPTAVGQIALGEVATGSGIDYAGRAVRTAVVYAGAAAVVTGVGGWFLIGPFFGPEFADARMLMLVLLGAEVLLAPFTVASRALMGRAWMGDAALLGLVAIIGAAVLYAVAIPALGSYGAAWACVLLYGGLSAVSWMMLRRRLLTWHRTPSTDGGRWETGRSRGEEVKRRSW
jgi:O-antigen/teichoic acid export membrane protein